MPIPDAGSLEERLLRSLRALREAAPQGPEPMFVFSVSPGAAAREFAARGVRSMRDGEALMACREAGAPGGA